MKSIKLSFLALFTVSTFALGCSTSKTELANPSDPNVISIPAKVPDGVLRYCWEEPIVEYEPQGPGLDFEEKWYHPSYLAVREIRQGKWRPCEAPLDELRGQTTNER